MLPNCIDSGATFLSVVLLKLGVFSSGCAGRLSMMRSLQCSWWNAVMWDSFSFFPNNLTASAYDIRMLNSYCTHCCISPWMNSAISGVHADAWVTFVMARSRDRCV